MWIVLALVTAVCTALRDVASKHATARADAVVVALGVAGVPAVTLGALVLFRGVVALGEGFWLALAISGGINAVATPLIVVALRRSDLSLVAPVTSLTPLFMIATGAVVLGEVPGLLGMLGVTVIVAGAYLLSISERHAGPLEPFRALVRNPGSRAMLFVAFFYAISATYDKVGTGASSPLMWAAAVNAVSAAALAPLAWWRWRRWKRAEARGRVSGMPLPGRARRIGPLPAILLAGLFTAIGAAAQMTALMMTLAAFVIAVKRTSTLFGVLLGHSVFREERVRERLLGAAVMLAGFVLVTLG
ncbi:MAG: EamA family transporter [Gemmatimonadetes bacterium]|nr:EamA family transporter [Gemmatimonadota bacterium]